jgi:hypothetical protein
VKIPRLMLRSPVWIMTVILSDQAWGNLLLGLWTGIRRKMAVQEKTELLSSQEEGRRAEQPKSIPFPNFNVETGVGQSQTFRRDQSPKSCSHHCS